MKEEAKILLTAVMFYTRIPCPAWVGHDENYLNRATRYLPLIGWLAGALAAAVYLAGTFLFGPEIGIILSIGATVLLTGAFHEDGFADTCDGFGGGWTKEKILSIMKDSRVGTYGLVGLVLLLSLKFLSLDQLFSYFPQEPLILLLVCISAHALSRFTAATFIFTHTYVRLSEDSKVKPVAQTVPLSNLITAALFAFAPLLMLSGLTAKPELLLVILPLLLLKVYLGRYFTKWIGGYTGDCLGATQQLSEVIIYLTLLLLWKFF